MHPLSQLRKITSLKQEVKTHMNKYEWTKELDSFLMQSVVRNHFNFSKVAAELSIEAQNLALDFLGDNHFDDQKCRIRWSYLHLQRKLGKSISYAKSEAYNAVYSSEGENNKENSNLSNSKVQKIPKRHMDPKERAKQQKEEAQKLMPQSVKKVEQVGEDKNYSKVTDRQEAKSMADIEANMWKLNVKSGRREKKDFLDISGEDFSKNTSVDINGNIITPSTFNIFRDSLKSHSEQLLNILNQNLPDISVKQILENDASDDDEIIPLDFRTAFVEAQNKVVIQVKPLKLRTDEDEEPQFVKVTNPAANLDEYLEMVRKEPFKEDEGAVIIEPHVNIKAMFDQVSLPCEEENRINNSLKAPVRSENHKKQAPLRPDQFKEGLSASDILSKQKMDRIFKEAQKSYDTDTDRGQSDSEKISAKPNQLPKVTAQNYMDRLKMLEEESMNRINPSLDFENSLKDVGLADSDLDDILGEKDTPPQKGLVQRLILENRKFLQEQMDKEKEEVQLTNDQVVDDLEAIANEEEESDFAPISADVDAPSKEEEKAQEQEKTKAKFIKSVQNVSSASETDEKKSNCDSDTNSAQNKRKGNGQIRESERHRRKGTELETVREKPKSKKVEFYKGQRVMSDTEEGGRKRKEVKKETETINQVDSESGSVSSHGSADEYFNQQRKMIRQKKQGVEVREERKTVIKQEEESEDENERRIEEERRVQMEMIMKKKREAEEREQREQREKEEERRRIEKEELQIKLKKQDEERKRRKREEKERKEKEREEKEMKEREKELKQQEIERQRREEEERERRERLKEEQNRLLQERAREEEERRKEEYLQQISGYQSWIKSGKTEIGCLWDRKVSSSRAVSGLPVDLDEKIRTGQVEQEAITFRRYKTLIIPITSLVPPPVLSSLLTYFLHHSSLAKLHDSENIHKSRLFKQNSFPFKVIGLQIALITPPFSKPSLDPFNLRENMAESNPKLQNQSPIKALQILLDTHDDPKTTLVSIPQVLKSIRLTQIFSNSQLNQLQANYQNHLSFLAQKYIQAGVRDQFPVPLGEDPLKRPLFDLKDQDVAEYVQFQASTATLFHLAFFAEYSKQDNFFPHTTMESWELFRRLPAFFAFNPNDPADTVLQNVVHSKKSSDSKKRDNHSHYMYQGEDEDQPTLKKVVRVSRDLEDQNVCVVLKDMAFDPLIPCKSENSVAYLLKKACLKEGLEIVGMRLVYMDDLNREDYAHLFHHSFDALQSWDKPVLVLAFRGFEAISKIEQIIGHFNPETARRTQNKNLRACFGRSREDNCVVQLYDPSKRNLELKYWFGGRVQSKKFSITTSGIQEAVRQSYMHLLIPSQLQTQFLFLSPIIPTSRFPLIIDRLTNLSISINDIQKIDFSFCSESFKSSLGEFKIEALNQLRGKNFISKIGYVLKVTGENIGSKLMSQSKNFYLDLDELLTEYKIDHLLHLSQDPQDFLSRSQELAHMFKVQYSKEQITQDEELDIKSLEQFKLFNSEPVLYNSRQSKLTQITSVSKKPVKPEDLDEPFRMSTFFCFLKLSSFKKQLVGESLLAILSLLKFELLGCKIVDGQKDLYQTNQEIDTIAKSVAYKFTQFSSDQKIKTKVNQFKALVLVLRGQNVENQIDLIYDRERLQFKPELGDKFETLSYQGNPHVIFMTQSLHCHTLLSFICQTKLINLQQDFKQNFDHLSNSFQFFEHTLKPLTQDKCTQDIETSLFSSLSQEASLVEAIDLKSNQFETVCVIKPNQSINIVLRVLKSVANLNLETISPSDSHFLQISKIEMTSSLSEQQIQHLFEHDIMFDESISTRLKKTYKFQYDDLFKGKPVVIFSVRGLHSISRLKTLFGNKDIHEKQGGSCLRFKINMSALKQGKDSLRQFYGVDRVDNAFYVSETVQEALTDQLVLFGNEQGSKEMKVIQKKQSQEQIDHTPIGMVLLNNLPQLALVVIAPRLVSNNDFIYILEEFHRQKFTIAAIKKMTLERNTLDSLFDDQSAKGHNINVLEREFKTGDSFLMVLEKEKALQEIEDIIGKFVIKSDQDWEAKKQQKRKGFQFVNPAFGRNEDTGLIGEYGSFIFSFGGVEQNKLKIGKVFQNLPGSMHYKMGV